MRIASVNVAYFSFDLKTIILILHKDYDTKKRRMKLAEKKAIITEANRSMGQSIAITFAQQGADVVISYRINDEEQLKQLLAKFQLFSQKRFVLLQI